MDYIFTFFVFPETRPNAPAHYSTLSPKSQEKFLNFFKKIFLGFLYFSKKIFIFLLIFCNRCDTILRMRRSVVGLYNKAIEEYYDGDEEAYSKNDFFDDNWSEFINFEYYYEIDDYEDLLDYVVDYYKKNVIKDIFED